MKIIQPVLLLAIALMPNFGASPSAGDWIVYVGTYTQQASKGIYAHRLNVSTGTLTPIGLAAESVNPSFLAVHPNGRYIYAVNEVSKGTLTAFSIDSDTSRLKVLNTVSASGSGPCHLSFDRTGKWLFVANYSSGSIATFPVRTDGTVGEASASIQHSGSGADPSRQTGPHAHSVNISPDNRFLVVSDLGLDKVLIYRFDVVKGTLTANEPAFAKVTPRAGPRHFSFGKGGAFGYVLNEMASTVTAFRFDKRPGSLTEIQTLSTLPVGFAGSNSGAEIAVHPNGRFLYSSNRGHDSISVFAIDAKSGTLRLLAHASTKGKAPRSFAIDPTGRFLLVANQNSNNIVVFRIDGTTGQLHESAEVRDVPTPVSLVFTAAR